MSVTLGEATSFLGQLVPVLIGIGVLYVGLRKWIRKVATSSEAAASQLTGTSGTTTVAEDVRTISQTLDGINGRLDKQEQASERNFEIATRASESARLAHVRIDQHLINDHGVHMAPRDPEEN